jgi:two-component system nitrogen regulation response regulator GlnG
VIPSGPLAVATSDRDLLDASTFDADPEAVGAATSAAVACLTIMCHPDPSRIGERVVLTRLVAGMPVDVSRAAPAFRRPGDDAQRPLLDPYLSRTPVRLRSTARGVAVDASEAPIELDGRPLHGELELDRSELKHGVLLSLSNRVALLLHQTAVLDASHSSPLIGYSDAIVAARERIKRAARLEIPVLVRGETGVGKELAARAIHDESARRARPFVAVNMATLTENTAPSSLFGHLKGAFTGALDRRTGLFEQADGGTLFLDEIGETPASVQPMLLRVLETGRLTPLGGSKEVAVDVRIVAATDAPLEASAGSGSDREFRAALLHRLAGYELQLPALREHRVDIPLLFVTLLQRELVLIGEQAWLDVPIESATSRIPTALVASLLRYAFPGNVRELRNLARHLLVACGDDEQLTLDDATLEVMRQRATVQPPPTAPLVPLAPPVPSQLPPIEAAALDANALHAALHANDYSPARTAAALGIPNSTLHYLMHKSQVLRRATDLTAGEIRAALRAHDDDFAAAARELQVSVRALRMAARRSGVID